MRLSLFGLVTGLLLSGCSNSNRANQDDTETENDAKSLVAASDNRRGSTMHLIFPSSSSEADSHPSNGGSRMGTGLAPDLVGPSSTNGQETEPNRLAGSLNSKRTTHANGNEPNRVVGSLNSKRSTHANGNEPNRVAGSLNSKRSTQANGNEPNPVVGSPNSRALKKGQANESIRASPVQLSRVSQAGSERITRVKSKPAPQFVASNFGRSTNGHDGSIPRTVSARDQQSVTESQLSMGKLVQEFLDLSRTLRANVETVFDQVVPGTADCLNSPHITLTDGGVISYDSNHVFSTGSGSKLFLTTNPIVKPLIVKFIEGSLDKLTKQLVVKKKILIALADEYALMKVFNGTNIVSPHLYEIAPNTIQPSCYVRFMVSEFVGAQQLKSIADESDPQRKGRIIVSVAARALELLRDLHNMGFIHGDIHFKNFVFTGDRSHAAESLRLIDFGRAEPYVNAHDGIHCSPETKSYGGWRSWHLSPWEIEGHRKTRRDDIFRLAETLLRSGDYDSLYDEQEETIAEKSKSDSPTASGRLARERIAQLKKQRPFDQDVVPPILIEFYQYTLTIKYADRPDYETWIAKFRNWVSSN